MMAEGLQIKIDGKWHAVPSFEIFELYVRFEEFWTDGQSIQFVTTDREKAFAGEGNRNLFHGTSRVGVFNAAGEQIRVHVWGPDGWVETSDPVRR